MQSTVQTMNEIRSIPPVIVGDKVFVGNLSASDLKIGKQLWENEEYYWGRSEMIYANDQLYVGYDNQFARVNVIRGTEDSGLLILDPETGDILWNFETDGEVIPTPAFYNDAVYTTTGGSTFIRCRSG